MQGDITVMQSTTKEILKPKVKQNLLSFKITRGEQGVELYLKSEVLENFFKRGGIDQYSDQWCNNKAYAIPLVKDHFNNLLSQWFGNLTINGGYPNLSFLRTVGINEGVTFILENDVYTRGEVIEFSKRFKEEVTNLFAEYIKPVTMEVELTTEVRQVE